MGFDPDAYLAKKPAAKFDPDAYLKAPSKNDAPSWGDALLAAPGAAVDEIGHGIGAAGHFIASLPDDPLGYKIGRGIAALPGAVANELGGMMQYARNLSPPEQRGSAPEMPGGEAENHPFLALGAGDTGPMRQNVAQHPLALALDAAGAAGMTAPGRAVMGRMVDAAKAPVRMAARTMADLTPANRAENQLLSAARQTSTPDAIVQALEGHQPRVEGVPLSAAQATQDPGLAEAEKQSRTMNGANWTQFDGRQNTALFNALHGVAEPATDKAVIAARDARDLATRHQRMLALHLADEGGLEVDAPPWMTQESAPHVAPPPTNEFAQPIRDAAMRQMDSDVGVHPGVQTTGNWVLNSVPRTGATAGRAYEVRKRLADVLNSRAGINPSDLDAAIKSSGAATGAIKSAIDTSLNKASGGVWQQYLDAFAANSADVNNVQALNEIREKLSQKIAKGAEDANGNPKLSRAYLGQTLDPSAVDDFGHPVFTPATRRSLENIVETAKDIEAPLANLKGGATGGGGPDTASVLLNHAARAVGAGPLARAVGIFSQMGEKRGNQLLTSLLQDPRTAAQALRNAADREAARKAAHSTGKVPAALAAALAAHQQH